MGIVKSCQPGRNKIDGWVYEEVLYVFVFFSDSPTSPKWYAVNDILFPMTHRPPKNQYMGKKSNGMMPLLAMCHTTKVHHLMQLCFSIQYHGFEYLQKW